MYKNIFIKITNLVDLDIALDDEVLTKKLKDRLLKLLASEVPDDEPVKLVENAEINALLNKLLKDAHAEIITRRNKSYKELTESVNGKSLAIPSRPNDFQSDVFQTALDDTLATWWDEVKKEKSKLNEILERASLERNNFDYFREISAVFYWFEYKYCHCKDSEKEFIKNNIKTIVESENPKKTLKALQKKCIEDFIDNPSDKSENTNQTSENIFIKITNLVDLDIALDDEVLTKKLKDRLLKLLASEVPDDEPVKLVENAEINALLNKLLKDAHAEIITRRNKSYKKLTESVNGKSLAIPSRPNDFQSNVLRTALHNSYHAWLAKVEQEISKLYKIIRRESLKRDNFDYYKEVFEVISWFQFDYENCEDSEKEFIKNNINTIIDSENPNKTLILMKYFQDWLDGSLSTYKCFKIEKDALMKLNQKKFIYSITDKNFKLPKGIHKSINKSALKDLFQLSIEIPKPISLFNYLENIWLALTNRHKSSEKLLVRFIAAFQKTKNQRKEYKNYYKELLNSKEFYEKSHARLLNSISLELNSNEINFKALVKNLCPLRVLERDCRNFGTKLPKSEFILNKLFNKYGYPNSVEMDVKGMIEVVVWIYKYFANTTSDAENEFMQLHMDKILENENPPQALRDIYLAWHRKKPYLSNNSVCHEENNSGLGSKASSCDSIAVTEADNDSGFGSCDSIVTKTTHQATATCSFFPQTKGFHASCFREAPATHPGVRVRT